MAKICFGTLLVAGVLCAHAAAQAQPMDYLDDRSTPEALVRSLYNAVSRKEYARAWDYFGDTKPSRDFKAFVQDYENTAHVEVETGPPSEEGAAGTIFYQVPVAIRATHTDGSQTVFAGCYTARLLQPQSQEPPFRPLQLGKATLKPAEGELAELVPSACAGGGALPVRDRMRQQIVHAFSATYGSMCQTLAADAEPGAADPVVTDLAYRNVGQDPNDPDRKARLFQFNCGWGAYNSNEIYYLADDIGEFRQLQFAEPELDIRYQDEQDQRTVESMSVMGYRTVDRLVNSFYDPATHTIHSHAKWRGVGDVSSSGTWLFRGGAFTLVKYDVDATYDEEINPETVVDYDTAP